MIRIGWRRVSPVMNGASVVTALTAMVCGADNAEEMDAWGEANEACLADFLKGHGRVEKRTVAVCRDLRWM